MKSEIIDDVPREINQQVYNMFVLRLYLPLDGIFLCEDNGGRFSFVSRAIGQGELNVG